MLFVWFISSIVNMNIIYCIITQNEEWVLSWLHFRVQAQGPNLWAPQGAPKPDWSFALQIHIIIQKKGEQNH